MKKYLLLLISFCSLMHCQKEEISIDTSVSEVFYLQNNQAAMPIRVHGNTASKTFMIMIHGGPGGDAIIYRTDYVRQNLESEFAVVYWDQRNSGVSQGGANSSFNQVADFVEDFEKVVVLLKKRYGADISIFVNGHSWGGHLVPAFLQKDNNQYSVKGWIQTAGAHNIPLLNELSWKMQLDKANLEIAANRDVDEWTKIREYCMSIKPPFGAEVSLDLNKNAAKSEKLTKEIPKSKYDNKYFNDQYRENKTPFSLLLLQSLNPVPKTLANEIFKGAQLSDHMDLIVIPTLLLYGKYDYICPAGLGDDIENRIKSAYKKKVIFEKSGHGMMAGADETAYWDEVKSFIRKFK
jgi:pimeloyl-ACP methyl ester carboxylesterase